MVEYVLVLLLLKGLLKVHQQSVDLLHIITNSGNTSYTHYNFYIYLTTAFLADV